MSFLRFFALTGLICFSVSCAVQEIPPPAKLPALDEVLTRLRGRKYLSSFRAVVLLEIHLSDSGDSESLLFDFFPERNETFAANAILLWKAPDAIRLEILSPFGSPVFAVTAKGARLRALSIPRGRYYVGGADRESMARWLGLSVSSALMVRILQGSIPVLGEKGLNGAGLVWSSEMGALRLEIPPEAGSRRQVVFLDLESFEPRRVLIGEEELIITYGPFLSLGAGEGEKKTPEWTVIEDLRRGHRIKFQVVDKNFRPAGDLADDLFHLDIPPGAPVIPLDGRGY